MLSMKSILQDFDDIVICSKIHWWSLMDVSSVWSSAIEKHSHNIEIAAGTLGSRAMSRVFERAIRNFGETSLIFRGTALVPPIDDGRSTCDVHYNK